MYTGSEAWKLNGRKQDRDRLGHADTAERLEFSGSILTHMLKMLSVLWAAKLQF
jgi:hypothetical protein